MKNIVEALSEVDSLLSAAAKKKKKKKKSKKKASKKKKTAKKASKKKAPVKKKKTAKKVVPKRKSSGLKEIPKGRLSGSARVTAAHRQQILRAMATKPNLKALLRVIKQGHVTAHEVVLAFEEALKVKRVNPRMAETIGQALRDVFDVIDVGETPDVIDMPSSRWG